VTWPVAPPVRPTLDNPAYRRQRQGIPFPEADVKDAQLKALIKKTAKQAEQRKPQARGSFDPTLDATKRDAERDDREAKDIFREMKRREF
jgi:hypothetical protein